MADSQSDTRIQLECDSTLSSQIVTHKKSYTYPAEHILPPCKVCGDKASGYHFGAITCEACKVFFLRSLGRDKKYKCKTKTDKCMVTCKRKPICPYCRYEKCKDIPMSREAIKMGRYVIENRTKFIQEAVGEKETHITSRTEKQQTSKPQPVENQIYEDIITRTTQAYHNSTLFSEEMILTLPDKIKQRKDDIALKEALFGKMGVLPNEVYSEVSSSGIDPDESLHRFITCMKNSESDYLKYIGLWRELPGFSDLALSDKCNMTKANVGLWFALSHHPGILVKDRVYICPSCAQVFRFEEMFGLGQDMIENMIYIFQKIKDLNLSDEEMALFLAIALLSTDDVAESITEPDAINALSDKFVDVLVYHLAKTRQPGHKTFPRIAECLMCMKSFNRCNITDYRERIMERWGHFKPDVAESIPELVKELKGLHLT